MKKMKKINIPNKNDEKKNKLERINMKSSADFPDSDMMHRTEQNTAVEVNKRIKKI
jgi:hypothetical protein